MSAPKIRTVEQLLAALRNGGVVSKCRSTGRINLGLPDPERTQPTIYGMAWYGQQRSQGLSGRATELPSEHGDWIVWQIAPETAGARTHNAPG